MVTTERSAPSDREEQPSILAQLRAWSAKHPLRPEGGGPPALCDPDEIPIIWAHDDERSTLMSRRAGRAPEVEALAADPVVIALEQAIAAQNDEALATARAALYEAALGTTYRTSVPIAEQLAKDRVKIADVRPHIRWLLMESRHGEAIDLAICLVLRCRIGESVLDDLYALGRHPWLWGLVVWLLKCISADELDLRWARVLHTYCCERKRQLRKIAPLLADRPDIRSWILRRGRTDAAEDFWLRERSGPRRTDARGELFSHCVAATCAEVGDLAGALADPDVDDELLDGACGILCDLLNPLGTADIETYPDAVLAVDRLLRHLLDRCKTLEHLCLVHDVMVWLEWPEPAPASVWQQMQDIGISRDDDAEPESPWPRRETIGWTEEVRATLTDTCRRILRRPICEVLVRDIMTRYETTTHSERFIAWRVAPDVGVDLWEDAFRWLERFPLDTNLYWWLLTTDDTDRVRRVIEVAERLLPRAARDLANGRSAQDQRWRAGSPLALVMLALRYHQVYSERIVALALRLSGSGPHSGRRHVLAILERQPTESWGEEVVAALRMAAADKANQEDRDGLERLLNRLE